MRETYSNLAELEEFAWDSGIDIREPFCGTDIGAFKVLSPSKKLFGNLLLESTRTPDRVRNKRYDDSISKALQASYNWISDNWGYEYFPEEGTSSENEMSVVQWANFDGVDIILTGDAGRKALEDVVDVADLYGLKLPLGNGSHIQVPHHGSRRNVDEFLLDCLLGEKSSLRIFPKDMNKSAYVCAAAEDNEHPKKVVIRGFMHRGAKVLTTQRCVWLRTMSASAPLRMDSSIAYPVPYPETQEVD